MNRFEKWSARLLLFVFVGAGASSSVGAEPTSTSAGDAERTRGEITELLNWFLSPEANPTRAAHERFWADDLVYTSSAGKVTNKAEILSSFAVTATSATSAASADAAQVNAEPAKPAEPETVYSAEEIQVRPYGEMAALNFRLVGRAPDGTTTYYRNSGTFLRRDGRWQAITWQATREAAPK